MYQTKYRKFIIKYNSQIIVNPLKDDKFTPLHLKRKKKVTGELSKPHIFEIMPPSGTMLPGQKLNIQIKFMPIEEVNKKFKLKNLS